MWQQVTGDTYIVHGTPVFGPETAGFYMAKYMGKEFDGERAAQLGMARRWSSSRGWPGSGRLRLRYTERSTWLRTSWAPHHVGEDLVGGPADLLVRSGDNLTQGRQVELGRKRFIKEASRYATDGSA